MVAHACHPSYMGSINRKIMVQAAQQVQGSGFKLKYRKKKKKKPELCALSIIGINSNIANGLKFIEN
jgi:ribosomal protein L20